MNFIDIIDFKSSLYFPKYYTVLADKCFHEVLGESKSKVKKVMWSEIVQRKVIEDDSDILYFKYINFKLQTYIFQIYKKYKFKTTNTRHIEMIRTAKRQKYKSQKGITSTKKKDLLMLCKKGLIPKQHHAFFRSPTMTTSGGRKMILILTVILIVKKMNLLIYIKIGQNLH